MPRKARGKRAPILYGFAAGSLLFLIVMSCLIGAQRVGELVIKEVVDEDMTSIAQLAAQNISPGAHAALRRNEQLNSPEYLAVVTPLREMLKAAPHLVYMYTVRTSDDGPRFGVDAAEPVDSDGDGVIDQAKLNELYEDPDPAMVETLRTGLARVSAKPYTDKWGTFISAFAPVRAPDGTLECVVGVDAKADDYVARLARMNRAMWFGGGVGLLASGFVAAGVAALQRRRDSALSRLEESGRRFRLLADSTPILIWTTRADGTVEYLNKTWLDFTGRPMDQEMDGLWIEGVHPEDRDWLRSARAAALEERTWFEVEYRFRRRDGEYRWVLNRAEPRFNEDGSFAGYIGGCVDVTARHDAAAQQAAALELAIRLAGASNTREASRAVNDAIANMCGIERSAVLLYDDDRVCRFVGWRGISPEYRRAVEGHCPWPYHASDADPIVIENVHEDPSVAHLSEVFERERIGTLAFIPVLTENGVVGKLMLYHEATGALTTGCLSAACAAGAYLGMAVGRLGAQERLALNEQKTRMVIDTALDAVVSLDADGKVTDWNAQATATFGWGKAEVKGLALAELIIPPDHRDAYLDVLTLVVASDGSASEGRRAELPAVCKDGTQITIELSVSAAIVGETVAYNVFLRDITSKKRSEADLLKAKQAAETASQAKTEFLANMSHEIRTPMTAILGFADLLAHDGDLSQAPARRAEAITTIRRNGEHLLAIINDILDLSKIEAGKMTVEQIPCSPAAIVGDVLSLMGPRAAAKGLTLELKRGSRAPAEIRSDPTRLRQILINLAGNAIKFTESGSVTIAVDVVDWPTGPLLQFEVTDTGIGLSSEQIGRLFAAFEQADTSMSRRFGGTGLGLRISKLLSRMLGGDITIRSEVGKGSTFTVTIGAGTMDPSTVAPLSLVVTTTQAASGPPDITGMLAGVRVLLAEDGLDNQRLICHHLKKAGAVVTVAENGRIAVEKMSSDGTLFGQLMSPTPFDVVLMDMQMPELDGYNAVRWLRNRGCAVPVIALTAHAMSGDRDRCIQSGCDDYATKPIDRDKLIELCRQAANGSLRSRRVQARPAA